MRTPRRPLGFAILIAALSTTVAALARVALDPFLGDGAPLALFLIAVLTASWFGGFWPGVLTTIAGSVIADFLFLEPRGSFSLNNPNHITNLGSYLLVGLGISIVGELWHRASAREQVRTMELEELVGNLRLREESLRVARRLAEARLRESEEQFKTIADLAPAKIWITNADGRCVYLSPKWYAFSGRTPEQDLGLGWKEILHPEDKGHLEHVVGDATARRVAFGLDARFLRHDGVYRWMASTGNPRFGESGEFLGFVGVVVDIHERKIFEQELKEAGRRKDEFLATLAHELRNPLAPIRNGLHVMRLAGQDSGSVERARDMIDRQLGQMVRLIDDLLDVSRITSGKIELRRSWINLHDAVQSAVETSRPLIDAQGQDLEVTLPSEPILLDADLTRLAQAFSNLLQNAAKFSERGGRISLTARRDDGRVVVSVRDTGAGIPADLLPHVFGLFMQGDRALGRQQGGLGIGLTLVRRLVELHGGTVEAKSEGAGLGSEFVVTLPVVELPETRVPVGLPPAMAHPVPASRRRVLVVDDNEDSVGSLAELVTLMGHESVAARDGEEALRLAESFRPDTVLLDLGMPRMSGYDVCRALRAKSWGGSMVIVALTGWGQSEDRARTRAAGFDAHIVKPLDPVSLAEFLAKPESRMPAAPLRM
jgi:PAS domain S-box-containing protein